MLTLNGIINRFECCILGVSGSFDHGEHELESIVVRELGLVGRVAVQAHAQHVEQILQILGLFAVRWILLAIFLQRDSKAQQQRNAN